MHQQKLPRSCPHKSEPFTFTEQRSEPKKLWLHFRALHHPRPITARTCSKPHPEGHIYLPSTTWRSCIGTSRSALDPSWFGLRPYPCAKGSYLRLDFKIPAPALTQAEHEKFRRQQARINSRTWWDVSYNLLLSRDYVSNPSSRFTLGSLHPRNVLQFGHFPRCCGESTFVQIPQTRLCLNEHLHLLVQHAKPHVQTNAKRSCQWS